MLLQRETGGEGVGRRRLKIERASLCVEVCVCVGVFVCVCMCV